MTETWDNERPDIRDAARQLTPLLSAFVREGG